MPCLPHRLRATALGRPAAPTMTRVSVHGATLALASKPLLPAVPLLPAPLPHTVVVFVALCLFAFEIYATPNTGLGSPSTVWEHLTAIVQQGGAYKGPVADNKGGSYLTM